MRICLGANALFYEKGGGHAWAYLNWALALRSAGCEVLWLESARENEGPGLPAAVAALREALGRWAFDDALILDTAGPLPDACDASPLEAAFDADLLLDLGYMPREVRGAFRRAALIDIDPGLTQRWWAAEELDLSGYDLYFTVGEGVAAGRATVTDCGVRWRYVPPCVDLGSWPMCPPVPAGSPWTTIAHWWGGWEEMGGEVIENTKSAGFRPLLELPVRVAAPLELALGGLDDVEEQKTLERHGWRVVDTAEIASTPEEHRAYIQRSRGEFSAAKPLYVRCLTGWMSDRTVCYLASGRPAVVEDTGDRGLGQDEGLLTFSDLADAQAALERVERDYERHAHAARALAEERYAGAVVVPRVLADALA